MTNAYDINMTNADIIIGILSEAIVEAAKVALNAEGTAYEAAMIPAIEGVGKTFRALGGLEG